MILRLGISFRAFSTSLIVFSAKKEARVMNKLLKVSSKKRSWYTSKEVSVSSLPQQFRPQKGERNVRRIAVLNKLFMKYISDILSTGEISNELAGLGLDISKVKISQDFGTLNVYWITKGTIIDKEIENILKKNAGKLRHELTQLKVIGNVPTIQFVKDRSLSKLVEVDALLAKADYGDDFEPTDPSLNLLSEFTLSSKLPPEIQEKILNEENSDVDDDPLPSMTMNVLGLDHDVVMQKVLRSINKSHASHRLLNRTSCEKFNDGISEVKHVESSVKGNEEDVAVQHSDLKKFVAKRMALHRKLHKAPRNGTWENDLICNEQELLQEDDNDGFEISGDFRRLKELEYNVDDFDEIVEKIDSSFYKR